MHILLVARQRW